MNRAPNAQCDPRMAVIVVGRDFWECWAPVQGPKRMKAIFCRLVLLGAVLAAAGHPARAQDAYPSRPITLVVPVPPGGASDFVARTIGQKLSEAVGQPVIISNQGGASGT